MIQDLFLMNLHAMPRNKDEKAILPHNFVICFLILTWKSCETYEQL